LADRARGGVLARARQGFLGLRPRSQPPTWEAIGRYVHEQGLSPRVVAPEELFARDVE
jgi:hypothetical protein